MASTAPSRNSCLEAGCDPRFGQPKTQTLVVTTSVSPTAPEDVTLTGDLELRGSDNWTEDGDGCEGTSPTTTCKWGLR